MKTPPITNRTTDHVARGGFLADCAAVTAGRKRIRTLELLSLLGALDRRVYGGWDARRLTAALGEHDIRTVKVHGRVCVRAADIHRHLDNQPLDNRDLDNRDPGDSDSTDPWLVDDPWDDAAQARWLAGQLGAGAEQAEQARQDWTRWADAVHRLRRARPALRRLPDTEALHDAPPVLPPTLTASALDTALAQMTVDADAIAAAYRRAHADLAAASAALEPHDRRRTEHERDQDRPARGRADRKAGAA